MRRIPKTIVTRVPKGMHDTMLFWKKALRFKTDKEAWNHVFKIYKTKSSKVYPKEMFKI